VAAGLAARVLARPVENDALVAADPVVGVVAGGLGGERVLDRLGRREVGQARLLRGDRRLLLGDERAAAALDEVGAGEGRVRIEGEEPVGRLPDAAKSLELLLDGEGLAGDDEVLGRDGEEEREHLVEG